METQAGGAATAAAKHVINIVVEVDGKNKHVQFDSSPVTGRAIREQSGTPLSDDLTRLVHGKPSGGNIGLDDAVEIKDGDHFIALVPVKKFARPALTELRPPSLGLIA